MKELNLNTLLVLTRTYLKVEILTFQRRGAGEQSKDVLRQVSMQRIFKMQANIGQLNNSKSYEPICFERGKRYVLTLSTDWIYGDWRLNQ